MEGMLTSLAAARREFCAGAQATRAYEVSEPWLASFATTVDRVLRSREFPPLMCLAFGLVAVLLIVLNGLRNRALAEAEDLRRDALAAQNELRERQREHVVNSEDRLAELDEMKERHAEAVEALHKLKQRCARRVAFVRHLRAVNANLMAEADEMASAIDTVVAQTDGTGDDAASATNTSTAGSSAQASPADFSGTVGPEDAVTPAPRDSSRRDAGRGRDLDTTPAAQLFASPSSEQHVASPASEHVVGSPQSDFAYGSPQSTASGHLGTSPVPHDASTYSIVEGVHRLDTEAGDSHVERLAKAAVSYTAACQLRDAAMLELHAEERTAELLEEEMQAANEDRALAMEELRVLVEATRDELLKETTPARRERVLGEAQQQHSDAELASQFATVTAEDIERLTFDPEDAHAVEAAVAECDELEATNAELLTHVTEGYVEMDELEAFALEQEATIAQLEEAALMRQRCFGSADEETVDPENDEDVADALDARDAAEEETGLEVDAADVHDRSVQRQRRIEAQTDWLGGIAEHQSHELNETIDRRAAAHHELLELEVGNAETEAERLEALARIDEYRQRSERAEAEALVASAVLMAGDEDELDADDDETDVDEEEELLHDTEEETAPEASPHRAATASRLSSTPVRTPVSALGSRDPNAFSTSRKPTTPSPGVVTSTQKFAAPAHTVDADVFLREPEFD